MLFAAVRLVWDAALGPELVPYPPDRPFASDDQYQNWGLVLAVAYLLTCAPVVVFLGAYPILFALNPIFRFVESHRRLPVARAAWAFCVAAAIVYYEVIWRYLAYPFARIVGMWVSLLVAFAFAVMWLKAKRIDRIE
jgi:ABC-type enterochelin transport system permease subunit